MQSKLVHARQYRIVEGTRRCGKLIFWLFQPFAGERSGDMVYGMAHGTRSVLAAKCLKKLERAKGIEPSYTAWETAANDCC